MGTKCNHTGPIGSGAKLTGCTGDTILQLRRTGLKFDAIALPCSALIRCSHNADGGKTILMPRDRLRFRITG
jgi:hypothetical protein